MKKEKTKYVYVLSRHESQFLALKHSLQSLTKFVNPESIVIFYTLPTNPLHLSELKKYELKIVPNIYQKEDFYYFAMNRLYLCTLDADNLIYLDNDTEILFPPPSIFYEDFDVAGRICGEGNWKHIGAQFIFFKNKSQKILGPIWKRCFEKMIGEKNLGLYDEVSLYQAVKELKLNLKELPKGAIIGYQIPENNLNLYTCIIHHSKDFYYK